MNREKPNVLIGSELAALTAGIARNTIVYAPILALLLFCGTYM